MSHQDWNVITFNKRPKEIKVNEAARLGNVETFQKGITPNKQSGGVYAAKLERIVEDGDAPLKLKLMDKKAVEAMKKGRSAKGLTQKQLAQQANIPENIIKNIEAGKEKHNAQYLQKIQRVLKVKLLGTDIGSEL